jgi:hypothetical protein
VIRLWHRQYNTITHAAGMPLTSKSMLVISSSNCWSLKFGSSLVHCVGVANINRKACLLQTNPGAVCLCSFYPILQLVAPNKTPDSIAVKTMGIVGGLQNVLVLLSQPEASMIILNQRLGLQWQDRVNDAHIS